MRVAAILLALLLALAATAPASASDLIRWPLKSYDHGQVTFALYVDPATLRVDSLEVRAKSDHAASASIRIKGKITQTCYAAPGTASLCRVDGLSLRRAGKGFKLPPGVTIRTAGG